jgi:PadR family transcriptional regulator, regulatory protein PadR
MPMKRQRVLGGMMTLLVLRGLVDGPSHGYALENYLSKKLERPIPPGTIYMILSSLNRQGFVSMKERTVINGRAITNYELTQLGREFLLQHKEPMLIMRNVIDDLLRAIENL